MPLTYKCGVRDRCGDCRRVWSARTYVRTAKALEARGGEERRRWKRNGMRRGARPMLVLLTLTLADSGDLAGDETKLKDAWHDWRCWLRRRLGRTWPYELRVEVTPGTHGRGHVHLHAVAFLPFVSFADARDAWMRAVARKGGMSTQWDARTKRTTAQGLRSAARYLAQYAAKGLDIRHLPALAVSWRQAHYGRRTTTASRGWFVPAPPLPCDECGEFLEISVLPRSGMDAGSKEARLARLAHRLAISLLVDRRSEIVSP